MLKRVRLQLAALVVLEANKKGSKWLTGAQMKGSSCTMWPRPLWIGTMLSSVIEA
jgi:hypothetical protein